MGNIKQLARPQQKVRIRRLAEALIALGESFVDEYASRRKDIENAGEQRPVQIVVNDHTIELPAHQWPRPVFQVGLLDYDARNAGQCGKRLRVAVDGANPESKRYQKAAMPTAAASEIQNFATRYDRARPASDPLRRLIEAVDLIP
jgi:hypothetical protein